MSINRIYICDLCQQSRDERLMIGLRWDGANWKCIAPVDGQRHLCTPCLKDLQTLPAITNAIYDQRLAMSVGPAT